MRRTVYRAACPACGLRRAWTSAEHRDAIGRSIGTVSANSPGGPLDAPCPECGHERAGRADADVWHGPHESDGKPGTGRARWRPAGRRDLPCPDEDTPGAWPGPEQLADQVDATGPSAAEVWPDGNVCAETLRVSTDPPTVAAAAERLAAIAAAELTGRVWHAFVSDAWARCRHLSWEATCAGDYAEANEWSAAEVRAWRAMAQDERELQHRKLERECTACGLPLADHDGSVCPPASPPRSPRVVAIDHHGRQLTAPAPADQLPAQLAVDLDRASIRAAAGARRVPCPDCGAAVDHPCKRPSGHRVWGGSSHAGRLRAAGITGDPHAGARARLERQRPAYQDDQLALFATTDQEDTTP